jgi:hypothetical protein
MKADMQVQQGAVAEVNSNRPAKRSLIGVENKKNALPPAAYFDGIDALDATLFAESFLKSPLAGQMLERGEAFKFFLPVQRSDCAKWGGVDITIAGVTKAWLIADLERSAKSHRGGGHSGSPYRLLKPGDYGVHSHPDTEKLAKLAKQTKGGPGEA